MANPEHLAILKQGVEAWNEWRMREPHAWIDLSGANLSRANLREVDLHGVYFRGADLRKADLRGADLREANLHEADLREASFSRAKLNGLYLRGQNLSGADLHAADLHAADLCGANLSGADLSGANLMGTNLSGANLNGVALALSNLTRANLTDATCVRADLREADLHEADLRRAELGETILTRANLSRANLSGVSLVGADLSEALLYEATLVNANLETANLSGCSIYGISAWGLELDGAIQSNLVITRADEPIITVDNLEVAQFIYLLLNNERIRDVINAISRKIILILGRFTPERKAVLDAIREELRKRDYLPILFDFDKPATRDYTETVRTLAHLSRFIIADLTDPSSIPQELQAVVPDLAVPVQPLLLSGQREFSMFVDLRKKYHWVLATQQYTDISDLLASLGDKVIAPAEQKAKELEKR